MYSARVSSQSRSSISSTTLHHGTSAFPDSSPSDIERFFNSTEMGANKKLFGKDLSEYDNMDMDDMLDQLTAEEIDLLTRDVDPDDTLMPPDQRTSYRCEKEATGPLNRKQLIDHINEQAMTEPDRPEVVPFEPGTVRGKKWVPPPPPADEQRAEEQVALDMGDEYESALADATETEMVDLAAILGFHSMMNQDQYHASLLGKKLDTEEVGWGGITRASRPKPMAPEPPNTTDPEQSIERIKRDDPEMLRLNLNNIKTISDEQFGRLCEAASSNTRLEGLLCSNTHMGDTYAEKLVQLIESNPNIKEISIESNFISPPMIARLVKALLVHKSIETFRAANQRSQVLGNKIEMEITKYVEQNPNILQLGLHFDFNDARARVSSQLQKNRDRLREVRHTGVAQPAATDKPEDDMSSEQLIQPEEDYSIQLPATESLPARSGGLRQETSAEDLTDGLGDDVRRAADDLAERAVRAAADLSAGLVPVTADAEQVAHDLTTVARDVDRVVEDVELAVTDVTKAVADVAKTVEDLERVEQQLERDFLDGDSR